MSSAQMSRREEKAAPSTSTSNSPSRNGSSKRGKESNSNSPARGSDRCRGFLLKINFDTLRPLPPYFF